MRPTRRRAGAPGGARGRDLGVVSLLTDISSESVSAILPLYLTAVVGLSPVAYGFVDGALPGRQRAGPAGRRLGRRPQRPAEVGGVRRIRHLGVARVFLLFGDRARPASPRSSPPTGSARGIRTAPRDAMISAAATQHTRPRIRRAPRRSTQSAPRSARHRLRHLWQVPDGYHRDRGRRSGFALAGVALLGLLVPGRAGRRRREQPLPGATTSAGGTVADRRAPPLLVVAGGLGLLTVGDGFVYLALLRPGGFGPVVPPLLRRHQRRLPGPRGAARPAGRPGRAGPGPGRRPRRAGRGATSAPRGRLGRRPRGSAPYSCSAPSTPRRTESPPPSPASGRARAARASGIAAAQTVVAMARMGRAAGFGVLWFAMGPRSAMTAVAVVLVVSRRLRGDPPRAARPPTERVAWAARPSSSPSRGRRERCRDYAYAEAGALPDRIRHKAPTVAVAPETQLPEETSDRVPTHRTGQGVRHGRTVPMGDPGGARAFTGAACDRVYASADGSPAW